MGSLDEVLRGRLDIVKTDFQNEVWELKELMGEVKEQQDKIKEQLAADHKAIKEQLATESKANSDRIYKLICQVTLDSDKIAELKNQMAKDHQTNTDKIEKLEEQVTVDHKNHGHKLDNLVHFKEHIEKELAHFKDDTAKENTAARIEAESIYSKIDKIEEQMTAEQNTVRTKLQYLILLKDQVAKEQKTNTEEIDKLRDLHTEHKEFHSNAHEELKEQIKTDQNISNVKLDELLEELIHLKDNVSNFTNDLKISSEEIEKLQDRATLHRKKIEELEGRKVEIRDFEELQSSVSQKVDYNKVPTHEQLQMLLNQKAIHNEKFQVPSVTPPFPQQQSPPFPQQQSPPVMQRSSSNSQLVRVDAHPSTHPSAHPSAHPSTQPNVVYAQPRPSYGQVPASQVTSPMSAGSLSIPAQSLSGSFSAVSPVARYR